MRVSSAPEPGLRCKGPERLAAGCAPVLVCGRFDSARLFSTVASALALISLFALGCSGPESASRRYSRVVTPLPPAFLTGPASLLLTNSAGFSARTELQSQSSLGSQKTSTGQLLGRGSKLLYVPDADDVVDAPRQPGEYSFIWDVAEDRGYVLSEALQAYAPITAALHATNVETAAGRMNPQRLGGHPCQSATVTVFISDSPAASFDVLQAMDLKGLPVRIDSMTNSTRFVLTLSKIRMEAPAAKIFSPPEGFTKYSTPESMADEIAARQHNLLRRNSPQMEEIMMPEQRRY